MNTLTRKLLPGVIHPSQDYITYIKMSQALGADLLGKNNMEFHATPAILANHGIGFIQNIANLE